MHQVSTTSEQTVVGRCRWTLTYGLQRGPLRVVQEHEVARLDVPVQDAVRVALRQRPQDCTHVAGHLQVWCTVKLLAGEGLHTEH